MENVSNQLVEILIALLVGGAAGWLGSMIYRAAEWDCLAIL
jgi:uncharacterized membrane protein YeaQ/YmgE (transglycosylase-associated protein family)